MDSTARNLMASDGGRFVVASMARRASGLTNDQWRALPPAEQDRRMRAAAESLAIQARGKA